MLYWECKRRLALLIRFKHLGAEYYRNTLAGGLGYAQPVENDTAKRARHEINLILPEVIRSFDLVGVSRFAYYSPPPAIGGYAGPLDYIGNLFDLWQFRLDPQRVADITDQAIGEYQRVLPKALRQMFNPLFWISLAPIWLLSSFLRLFSRNWDVARVAGSLVGRLVKFIVNLAFFLAAVLAILYYMGRLDWLKGLLGISHK